ncbi:MAG: flippase-like domain-containing protein [Flavobacteriales bacterium]|nr:flippase-like domain-containing protein [Flavobacteriales bacterium]MCB9192911.1 flippase-like domain-containing protein [Flavobacteriales bacterium]
MSVRILHLRGRSLPFRIVRWAVFLAACVYLYVRLSGAQGTSGGSSPPPLVALCLAGVLLGMVANWGLEAWKWRRLIAGTVHVPFGTAVRAILAGTTVGLITPNRTGEFLGRVAFLPAHLRDEASFITVLGSITQFAVTILVGAFAMSMVPWLGPMLPLDHAWSIAVGTGALLLGSFALILLVRPVLIVQLLERLPGSGTRLRKARVLSDVPVRILWTTLGFSALRYLVFTLQFACALHILALVPWSQALIAVPIVFLCTTLIPTAVLTELGVRGSVAVAVLAGTSMEPANIAWATSMLWAVNLALPALAGGAILLQMRANTETSVPSGAGVT